MTTHPTDDPTGDWFRRNRHILGWAVWAFLMIGGVFALVTDPGPRTLTNETARGAFWGAVTWSWASQQDRAKLRFWKVRAIVFGVVLGIYATFAIVAAVRGTFEPFSLVAIGVLALLMLGSIPPYLRIRSGRPWPPERKTR